MSNLGWNDPVEGEIKIAYRRKGERREHEFDGSVFILDVSKIKDEKNLTHVPRENLPIVNGILDMTKISVVGIGGKRKRQMFRVLDFLGKNPDFHGAILLYPGSGNWDLGEGILFFTEEKILHRISQ